MLAREGLRDVAGREIDVLGVMAKRKPRRLMRESDCIGQLPSRELEEDDPEGVDVNLLGDASQLPTNSKSPSPPWKNELLVPLQLLPNLVMLEHARTCQNMPEHARRCQKMPEDARRCQKNLQGSRLHSLEVPQRLNVPPPASPLIIKDLGRSPDWGHAPECCLQRCPEAFA